MSSRRNCLLALIIAVSTCGCANLWHELQPHRLKKWNSFPAPSLSPEFTSRSSSTRPRLVRRDRPMKPASLSANSADIVNVRQENREQSGRQPSIHESHDRAPFAAP